MTWKCCKCGEDHEDRAEVCWYCGTTRDGKQDPFFKHDDEMSSEDWEEPRGDRPAPPSFPGAPEASPSSAEGSERGGRLLDAEAAIAEFLRRRKAIVGRAGRLRIRIGTYDGLDPSTGTFVEAGTMINIDGLKHAMSLRQEGIGAALKKMMGEREIEIGDEGS
jgi:hypothetical protein